MVTASPDVEFADVCVDYAPPSLPLMARARRCRDLSGWARDHRQWVLGQLTLRGAILFRGFHVPDQLHFERILQALGLDLHEYLYRSTPRTALGGRIYTATEYPAHQRIPLHNENSYQHSWPQILVFCCMQPAERCGETPLASTLRITSRLDAAAVRDCVGCGILYVRNFGRGIDLPWQTVFQTQDRSQVEAFCADNGIRCIWSGDLLRTEQIRPAMQSHPLTGQSLWFNQAHLFHVSALDPRTRTALSRLCLERELPRNAYYGDGTDFPESVLQHIRCAYESESTPVHWQQGDVLILDNMLVCHGRGVYEGQRRLLLAMANRPAPAVSGITPECYAVHARSSLASSDSSCR
jgi:alpha-ketoglutarate-dependent taurine dioxygenase